MLKKLLLLTLCSAAAHLCMTANASDFTPEQVRATFLFRIIHFARFPQDTLPSDKINFCFVEAEDGAHAEYFTKSPGTVLNRQVSRVQLSDINDGQLKDCQLLFIAQEREQDINQTTLAQLNSQAISVGETMDFLERGGMVAILPVGSKMKIFLNQNQYSNSTLQFSSDLLKRVKFTR